WASVAALAPAMRRARRWPWRRALNVAGVLGIVAAAAVGHLRLWVPPAPLTVARAALAWSMSGLDPAEPLGRRVSVAERRQFGGVFAYTAVYAPRGLRPAIVHASRRCGPVVDSVALCPRRGGRPQG